MPRFSTPQEAIDTDPFKDIDMHAPYMTEVAAGMMLEIGVRHGCSTGAFLRGLDKREGHLYSLDINPDCGKLFDVPNWTFICGDSQKPETILSQIPKELDVLFIDGDHSYEGVRNDLNNYGPLVKSGGKIVMHDVVSQYDPGVRKAADEYVAKHGFEFEIFPSWVGLGTIHVK